MCLSILSSLRSRTRGERTTSLFKHEMSHSHPSRPHQENRHWSWILMVRRRKTDGARKDGNKKLAFDSWVFIYWNSPFGKPENLAMTNPVWKEIIASSSIGINNTPNLDPPREKILELMASQHVSVAHFKDCIFSSSRSKVILTLNSLVGNLPFSYHFN